MDKENRIDTRETRNAARMARKPHRRRKKRNPAWIILVIVLLAIAIPGGIFLYGKYAPTRERMEITDLYRYTSPDEAALITNNKYSNEGKEDENHDLDVIISADKPYLRLAYLKAQYDDGYVFDKTERILRYTTDKDLVSVEEGKAQYTVNRETKDHDAAIIINAHDDTYVNLDFVKKFTDIEYGYTPNPARVIIDSAGETNTVASLLKDAAIRRFGGPKSKILEDGLKGESIRVLENYGKWSQILTSSGVLGCVENGCIGEKSEEIVPSHIEERVFGHHLYDGRINMAWHLISNNDVNSQVESAINNTYGLNVISPTWYRLSDNEGNIQSMANPSYISTCRARGIKVWAMVSNFEIEGVDSTTVLNRTSSRDNLVNNLIGSAITDNVDGINIDFESLSIEAKDGFIQFIRELGLKCHANNIVLSVVNYKPEAYTAFYNRAEQAKYADYVMCIGYDEFHSGSDVAGSNSSLPFVSEGVKDTLLEVPANQLILALPFYTRVWINDSTGLTNKAVSMGEAQRQVSQNDAEKVWLPEEQQYYAKYEKEGKTYQVWLEDEQSLAAKLSVMKENNLAGVSFWKLGFEPASIWNVIAEYIN